MPGLAQSSSSVLIRRWFDHQPSCSLPLAGWLGPVVDGDGLVRGHTKEVAVRHVRSPLDGGRDRLRPICRCPSREGFTDDKMSEFLQSFRFLVELPLFPLSCHLLVTVPGKLSPLLGYR